MPFRRFSDHHQDLAVGCHSSFTDSDYFLHFLLIRICTKSYFGFMLTFNDSIGTLASDFLPILNDYYTEITALVIGILFHISSTIILKAVKDINSILPKFP
jgi:hypothetical protein